MKRTALMLAVSLLIGIAQLAAQDRLTSMPGYDHFTRMEAQLRGAFVTGAVGNVRWADDGASVTYLVAGRRHRFDVATRESTSIPGPEVVEGDGGLIRRAAQGRQGRQGGPPPARRGGLEQDQREMPDTPMEGCPTGRPARGRQDECAMSPDGTRKAFYRARNLWVADADGAHEIQVTSDGSVAGRIKNGSGSWVYGEELNQTTAIWWSPDSTKVGYYRFDESQVPDFFLAMNQTAIQTQMDVEAYPKAGAPNPIPEVFVFDVSKGRSTRMDIRDGKPFSNEVVGHYVYDVRWSPDGTELLLNRANRRQQIVELAACSPTTTSCRVIVREEWPSGWVTTTDPVWLDDGQRFIWRSERNGWKNYYLYDLTGRLLHPITRHTTFESGPIVKVDEPAGVLFYMARDGDNYMKSQLHRVGLDGRGDVRLTDPRFDHRIASCTGGARRMGPEAPAAPTCGISPDNRWFVDTYQTHDIAPATQVVAIESGTPGSHVVAQLAASDTTRVDAAGFRRAEQFTYLAADGVTSLVGQIWFPSNFDPTKRWPVLISVYGGPESGGNVPSEAFARPDAMAEYGFLIVNLSSRAAPGRGRRLLDSIYLHLGVTEVDDMAEGIKALRVRTDVDPDRIGMFGTSYGGYVSATMLLRHPDLLAAAVASSPPTSWYHYDSIYTERYMWIPQENRAGYEAGNDMNFADQLTGRLMLFYGTADNNVHPNNALQLIEALQAAGKSFDVQIGPDAGHSSLNRQRMMEFFIEHLVLHPDPAA